MFDQFRKTVVREFKIIFFVMTVGGGLVVIAMAMLWVNDGWATQAKYGAVTGVKILLFGYPLYLLSRLIRWIIKREKKRA